MRIIARHTLNAYVASLAGKQDQPAVKAALDSWYYHVKQVTWANAMALKATFGTASIVGDRVSSTTKKRGWLPVCA